MRPVYFLINFQKRKYRFIHNLLLVPVILFRPLLIFLSFFTVLAARGAPLRHSLVDGIPLRWHFVGVAGRAFCLLIASVLQRTVVLLLMLRGFELLTMRGSFTQRAFFPSF
mmetsp:Transcript_16238/g.33499  ORF Transcript_16238/g.33499 Transcript_16238/m.33499 type:complete len:111 (-) Transcript_16238:1061-1393(-)